MTPSFAKASLPVIVTFLFFVLPLRAQNEEGTLSYKDTLVTKYVEHKDANEQIGKAQIQIRKYYLEPKNFQKRLRLYFGQLATGQTTSSVLSNYADADITNGKLGFNGAWPVGGRVYLTLSAVGKINNSISELFGGFKLNNDVSADIKVHLRVYSKFWYLSKDAIELREKKGVLEKQKNAMNEKIKNDSSQNAAFIQLSKLKAEIYNDSIKIIHDTIQSLKGRLQSVDSTLLVIERASPNRTNTNSNRNRQIALRNNLNSRILSLVSDTFRIRINEINLRYMIDSASIVQWDTSYVEKITQISEQSFEKKKEDLDMAAPYSSIHIGWLTARVNPSRQQFYLYDSLQTFGTQITDTSFTTFFYGLEANYYYWTKRNFSVYGNLGFGLQGYNNLDTLRSYEVTDERKDDSGQESRKAVRKYNAYSGKYEEFKLTKIYGNFYLFGKGNMFGLHLSPELMIWESGATNFNFLVGSVISFKSRKDEKVIINAEPYIQWKDIFHPKSDGQGIIKRNIIGIRIGLPIGLGSS